MTVKIRKNGFKIALWFPTRFATLIIRHAAGKEIKKSEFLVCFKNKQKRELKKAVINLKKEFGKLELLSVTTSDKFEITVTL